MKTFQQDIKIAPSGYREMEKSHIIQPSSELTEREKETERKREDRREGEKDKKGKKNNKGLSG